MNFDDLSKEQQILLVMRKTLTSIARETAPQPGVIHPLSEQTVNDMRLCLGLISARERELADAQGAEHQMRPHFVDEPTTSQVISLDRLRRNRENTE